MARYYKKLYSKNKLAWKKLSSKKRMRKRYPKTQSVIVRDQPIPTSLAVFPTRARHTLRYSGTVDVSAAGNTITNWVFSACGIYDPDITGGGGQPLGRDTLELIYNHYQVMSSRIQVFFFSGSTQNVAVPVITCLRLDDDTSPPTTVGALVQNPRSKFRIGYNCPLYNDVQAMNKPMIMKFSAKKFFGFDWQNPSHSHSMDDNPTDSAFFILSVTQNPASSTGISMYALVVIDYNVEFSEPVDLAES